MAVAIHSAFEDPPKWCTYSIVFVVTRLVPRETGATSGQVLCIRDHATNHAPVYSVIRSHIRRVHVCIAVTCHLHLWQNDRNISRATAVTRGLNAYRRVNHYRKFNLKNKTLPPLLPGVGKGGGPV